MECIRNEAGKQDVKRTDMLLRPAVPPLRMRGYTMRWLERTRIRRVVGTTSGQLSGNAIFGWGRSEIPRTHASRFMCSRARCIRTRSVRLTLSASRSHITRLYRRRTTAVQSVGSRLSVWIRSWRGCRACVSDYLCLMALRIVVGGPKRGA